MLNVHAIPRNSRPVGKPPAFTDRVGGVAPVLPTQQQRQEQRGMNAAPNDERPIGAVPKTAHQEDDEDVADGFPFPHARSAERNVEVVAEPRRERDVPAPPKLRDVAGEVRRLEVGHELDAKELGGADGDVAVAGEIPVDLKGKIHGTEHEGGPGVFGVVGKDVIGINGAGIRHHHLLEHPPQDQPQAGDALLVFEDAFVFNLRQEPRSPLNRPGDELREEAHKRREIDEAARRLQVPAVNVNGIGEGLKRIEADAHRQDHLERRNVHRHARRSPRIDPAVDEEVAVLEVTQQSEVHQQRHPEPRLLGAFLLRSFDLQTDEVIHQGGKRNQPQKPPIPPPVKHIARDDEQHVLRLEIALHDKPIQSEDDRQEEQEFRGVEKHDIKIQTQSKTSSASFEFFEGNRQAPSSQIKMA